MQRSKILATTYDSKKVERRIYKLWLKSGFFNPDKLKTKTKKSFSMSMAPPNITGSLHMGHALEYTLSDILVRTRRMQGYKTLWLPGTDHAGIATQNVVEKDLKKQGIARYDLGREKFVEKIWEWKEKYGGIIINQLKTLGVSADWSRLRFTMDSKYQKAVLTAFIHYYNKGWVYRAERVINWCTRCQTSLSDLELEYKEEAGKLWHIRYKIKNQKSKVKNNNEQNYVLVATTRPETMLGDEAVAVNPNDERYKHLIGQKVILPIQEKEIPIIGDQSVDPKFGTGMVKVTPAHDMTDYEISLRHNLPLTKIIEENGRLNASSKICEGLTVEECRQKVVEMLRAQNLIEKEEDYNHNVAHCYRCGGTIEPLPSSQWFLKMDELAKMAIGAVQPKKVVFHPKRWEKIYFDWLKNIRDWCISRQLWWGHRLPVFFCQRKLEEIKNQKSKIKNDEGFIVSTKRPRACTICKNCEMVQSEDVLDTWFSSALWPLATLGWPARTNDLRHFYPTNVLTNDRGIINLWDARMIFSGLEFMKQAPFKDLIIHATILTKEGRRMSKSLGTGIDPMTLIETYGADATRFGLIWQSMGGQDIRWSEEHVIAGKKFCNKIWNAARFVLFQYGIEQNVNSKSKIQNSKLTKADKIILKKLAKTTQAVSKDVERYNFGQAAHMLYDFFWHDFCDAYLEQSKKQIENPKLKENTQKILIFALTTSLKLLHPFIPFITEEIYQKLPLKNKRLLPLAQWPKN